jgi:hypothetical protein
MHDQDIWLRIKSKSVIQNLAVDQKLKVSSLFVAEGQKLEV